MAIVFEAEKKPINWFFILSIVFAFGFIFFAGYYLFFAPSPKLEIVLPSSLERANQISDLQFIDPSTVLNSQNFKRLQNYIGQPFIGSLGRVNPFARF